MRNHSFYVFCLWGVLLLSPSISKAQEVFICTGKSATSYHKTSRCAGASCSKEVRCVTLAEAQRMHRKPCQRCLRGFIAPTIAVSKPSHFSSSDLSRIEVARTPQGRESQIVQHSGYTASYNSAWLVSNWVAYQLTPQEAAGTVKKTKHNCKPDPMVKGNSAEHSDYTNSGYCRGHLAPAMDMKWSETAMNESFYLTNICPQSEDLNNGTWHRIENNLHNRAVSGDTLYICCGPIMPKTPQRIGTNGVAIPTYCFKVVCMKKNGKWYGIGFVLPNMACTGTIFEYAMSIDEVEALTDLDFFYNLPDNIEEEVESKVYRKIWGL